MQTITSRATLHRCKSHVNPPRTDADPHRHPARPHHRRDPTDIWNDSCNVDELAYAVGFGAVGATANPTIVVDNWKKDPGHWAARVRAPGRRAADRGRARAGLGDRRGDERPRRAAALPAFEASGGRAGRLSIQTDPTLFRDADAMVAQAAGFDALAPNVIVKFPATRAGLAGMEEATYRGISINATVASACHRPSPLRRRSSAASPGATPTASDTTPMGPVITIMMGRLEDWLRGRRCATA